MSVNWTKIALPFLGGIDTKSDAKSVVPTRLEVLENGVFTKRGSIAKRHGYTALGNKTIATSPVAITEGRALATVGDSLVMFDSHKAYHYAPALDGWLDRGSLESVLVNQKTVLTVNSQQYAADRATANGVTVCAWQDSRGQVRYSVTDSESGALYAHDVALPNNTIRPKVLALNSAIFIFYFDPAPAELRAIRINTMDSTLTPSAAKTILVNTDIDSTLPIYDVEVHEQRIYLAACRSQHAGHDISLRTIRSDGTVDASLNYDFQNARVLQTVGITVDSESGTVALVWSVRMDAGGALQVYAAIFPTVFHTSGFVQLDNADLAVGNVSKNIAAAFTPSSNSKLWVWYEINPPGAYAASIGLPNDGAGNYYLNRVYQATFVVGTGATVKGTVKHRHSGIASRCWGSGGHAYLHLVHNSTLQSTLFAAREDGLLVTKELLDISSGTTYYASHLPQVEALGASLFAWAPTFRRRLNSDVTLTAGKKTDQNRVYTWDGIKEVLLDYGSDQSHRSTKIGKTLFVSGGLLWQYDGISPVESGFHLFTENIGFATTNTETNAGAWAYRVYYEWVNANGEREQSTAAAVVVTDQASDDNAPTSSLPITLKIPSLAHTGKGTALNVAVYRTAKNPTIDSPFYRVSSLDPSTVGASNGYLPNSTAADVLTFVDAMTDDDLAKQELDYQNTGEFENLAPAAASIMAGGKTRVFLAGFEDPNQVQFSKISLTDNAVAFNDTNIIQVDEQGGPITALAVLNEGFVVFKERNIFVFTGEGPNNLGQGAFGEPQVISSAVGCKNQRSVVVTDDGVYFQSDKGIWLLTQGLQLVYQGAEVEKYNSQVISAATRLADSNQVRFLTSAGSTLLFDSFFRQWGTFSNHEGVDAVLWDNTYVYLRPNGLVLKEDPAVFFDNRSPFSLHMETAWVKLDALQGFMRVRSALILGNFKSAHKLRVSVAYNYNETFIDTFLWDPSTVLDFAPYGSQSYGTGAYGGDGPDSVYQFKIPMENRQKCEAIKFRFEDVQMAPEGEAYEITELLLEVGMKRTPFKVRDAKSIG